MMYINCDMSGAYVSSDGGRFWRMIHHRQMRGNTRCKPAFHPKDPNVIYAPQGWGGRSLAVSRDKGVTWQKLGDVQQGLRGLILIDPDNPSLMLAGSGSGGAVISRNGGKSWETAGGVRGGDVLGFHFDRTSAPQRRTIFIATAGGVFRSDDGGASWSEKTSGLPWKKVLSFSGGSDPETKKIVLYVSIESRSQGGTFAGGIYRSTDKGESWQHAMGNGINLSTKKADQWCDGAIAQYRHVLTTDAKPLTVYSLNTSTGFWPPGHKTVYRSDDAGQTWRDTLFLDPRFPKYNVVPNYQTAATGQSYMASANSAAIAPTDPDRLLYVTGMPGFLTHNGGKSWFNAHCFPVPGAKPGPGTPFVCNGLVVTSTWNYYVDPFQHNRHYIAYTDIGFARSLDGGVTWIWWEKGKQAPWRNTCYEVAFDPEIPGKSWGAFANVHDIPNGNIINGRHRSTGPGGVCLSTDFCESWKTSNEGLPVAPATSVVVDPKSPKGSRTLYAGVFDKGVYKSTDDGKTWTKKSSGLGHPSNMRVYKVVLHTDGTLFALITAKKSGGFTSNGVGVWRSTDKAESWQLILKDPVLKWPKDFSVHPTDSKLIFVGAADAGDQSGGLYRTSDGGATWKKVARHGRQHFGAFFHPKRPNWVYLTLAEGSVENALYLSTDGGSSWKPFTGFPFGNTQRVTVDPDDDNLIYVTTFGGSVFRGPATPRQ